MVELPLDFNCTVVNIDELAPIKDALYKISEIKIRMLCFKE
jgi:hypothetical protein